MSSNFFDIPFRTPGPESDFACKDGELEFYDNLAFNPSIGEWRGTPPWAAELPAADVDFAPVRDVLPGWHAVSDDFPSHTLSASLPSAEYRPTMEYWNEMTARLLQQFKNEAWSRHLFVAPFYVMGVWKTVEGIYLNPSVPELLIPNSQIPPVASFGNIDSEEAEFKIAAAVCRLYFRMRAPEILRRFVGKVASLEIFVSGALHDYGYSSVLLPMLRVVSDSYCRELDPSTGEITNRQVCTETLPTAWRSEAPTLIPDFSGLKFYRFATMPLSEVDIADTWNAVGRAGMGSKIYENSSAGIPYVELHGGTTSATSGKNVSIKGQDSEFKVSTRPLKLSGAGVYKKIRHVWLRGRYDPSQITVKVYGSRDMRKWWNIGEDRGRGEALLPMSYFRFYRVEISGYLSEGETLEGLSLS